MRGAVVLGLNTYSMSINSTQAGSLESASFGKGVT